VAPKEKFERDKTHVNVGTSVTSTPGRRPDPRRSRTSSPKRRAAEGRRRASRRSTRSGGEGARITFARRSRVRRPTTGTTPRGLSRHADYIFHKKHDNRRRPDLDGATFRCSAGRAMTPTREHILLARQVAFPYIVVLNKAGHGRDPRGGGARRGRGPRPASEYDSRLTTSRRHRLGPLKALEGEEEAVRDPRAGGEPRQLIPSPRVARQAVLMRSRRLLDHGRGTVATGRNIEQESSTPATTSRSGA